MDDSGAASAPSACIDHVPENCSTAAAGWGAPGWVPAGLRLEERLGVSATGETWRAREVATGDTVVAKVLWLDRAAMAPDQISRAVARLTDVRHPHLVRLRDVQTVPTGVVLIRDHASGGSLADALAVHSGLTPGEVVTLGVALAAALTALHDAGLVHGAVTSGNVLFDAAGRPMLADYGVAALVGAAENTTVADEATAAYDVQALASLLVGALPPDAAAQLTAVLDTGGERAVAADLARWVRSAGPPAPVRLAREAPVEPPRQRPVVEPPRQSLVEPPRHAPGTRPPSRRTRWPSPVPLVGLPLALVAAVVVGRVWAAADRPAGPAPLQPARTAPPTTALGTTGPPTASAAIDWSAVLATLDQRRDAAMVNLDAAALADVYAAGSGPLAVDTASIRQLAAEGARAEGLRLEIRSVQLVRRTATGVTLRVVDRLPAYEIVDAGGRVLERRPGRGPVTWLVDLVPAGDGWRIAAVART